MLSAKRKYLLKRILPFGVIWLVLGALFLSIEEIAIGDLTRIDQSSIRLESDIVVYALVGIFVIGCFFGTIHVLWLDKLFKNRSLVRKVFVEFIIYLVFLELMLLINYPIVASMEQDTSLFDAAVWTRLSLFFWSLTHLSALLQMSFSILISLFYNEISTTVGQNVLNNFFTGKYHKPVEEDRIFMFVDMKDSTTIAEQLGHRAYFDFLQAYYDVFSAAIIDHEGEVYQYVGDEIVVSWKMKKGMESNNCVACFYDMKKAMQGKSSSFLNKYKVLPDFKAAIHYGHITTGEIGALKKDIFFTGDVLNTTARILSKSSEYDQDLLVSEELARKLNLQNSYELTPLGSQNLKGKKQSVNIMAVNIK